MKGVLVVCCWEQEQNIKEYGEKMKETICKCGNRIKHSSFSSDVYCMECNKQIQVRKWKGEKRWNVNVIAVIKSMI